MSGWSTLLPIIKTSLFIGGVFIVSFLLLGCRFYELDMTDSGMWGHEAQYVLSGDAREFNFLAAYGHPGGPVIEGAIALHALTGKPYDQAVLLIVTLIMAAMISCACYFARILRPNSIWWVAVLGVLSLNWQYDALTPPSAVAAVAVPLICLFTLYVHERREATVGQLVLWGGLVGMLVATRTDIGAVSSIVFGTLLLLSLGWRKMWIPVLTALSSFLIFDPFMWFMPVQHTKDLVFKMTYHYADFAPTPLSLPLVLTFSSISFISILLIGGTYIPRSPVQKCMSLRFFGVLLLLTIFLYGVFLSSHYQAIRYFLPLTLTWELFLPLVLFGYTAATRLYSTRLAQSCLVAALYGYNLFFLCQLLWIANSFHLLHS
jgi:hypothetical protein